MSLTTPSKLRDLQIKLYRQAKNWAPPSAIARHASIRSGISASSSAECRWNPVRESAVKPVGKPDAGNPHVRFDERGWETGRRSGVSARAHPRLYKLDARLSGAVLSESANMISGHGEINQPTKS